MIRLIAAMDNDRGIAGEHGIPWQGKIPTDTKYFRAETAEGAIVMGFRTYEELSDPLHDRKNFVVSRPGTSSLRPGFVVVPDLDEFLHQHSHELVWVIGGAVVFERSMSLEDELFITQLDAEFVCTKFFPEYESHFVLVNDLGRHSENGISFRFEIWHRGRATSGRAAEVGRS